MKDGRVFDGNTTMIHLKCTRYNGRDQRIFHLTIYILHFLLIDARLRHECVCDNFQAQALRLFLIILSSNMHCMYQEMLRYSHKNFAFFVLFTNCWHSTFAVALSRIKSAKINRKERRNEQTLEKCVTVFQISCNKQGSQKSIKNHFNLVDV